MTRSRIVLFGGAALCGIVLAATGARGAVSPPVEDSLRVAEVDASRWPRVAARVVAPYVLSGSALPPSAFDIRVAGRRVPSRADPVVRNRWDVALVLTAGSGTPTVDGAAIRGAALELVSRLPQGTRVAVLTDRARAGRLTRDRQHAGQTIVRSRFADSGDVLTSSSLRSAAGALGSGGRNRAVVVIGSVRHAGDVAAVTDELLVGGVQLYAVTLDRLAPASLETAAAGTGGRTVAVDRSRLVAAADGIVADLKGQYDLRFTMPQGGVTRTATIRVSAMGTGSRVSLTLAPTPPAAPTPATTSAARTPEDPGERASGNRPMLLLVFLGSAVTLAAVLAVVRLMTPRRAARHRAPRHPVS